MITLGSPSQYIPSKRCAQIKPAVMPAASEAQPISTLLRVIGFIGVVLAAGNAVGGYVVTERMLKMFVSAGKKKAA